MRVQKGDSQGCLPFYRILPHGFTCDAYNRFGAYRHQMLLEWFAPTDGFIQPLDVVHIHLCVTAQSPDFSSQLYILFGVQLLVGNAIRHRLPAAALEFGSRFICCSGHFLLPCFKLII